MQPGDRVRVRRLSGWARGEVVDVTEHAVKVRLDGRVHAHTVSHDRVQPERPAYVFTPQHTHAPAPDAFGLLHDRVHRDPGRARPARMAPRPRQKPARDADYLAYVRTHDCCVCGHSAPSEAHHFDPPNKGVGSKVDDLCTVPVCHECHQRWHGQKVAHVRLHVTGGTVCLQRHETERLFRDVQVQLLKRWILEGA